MKRRRHPASCRICFRHRDEAGRISARGKCAECAELLQIENVRQIRGHSGPFFRHWRRQMAASVGGRLLDEWPAEPQTDGE